MSLLWVKTAHILFVIAWVAGLFYLPRILVHYVEGKNAGEDTRRLVIMAENYTSKPQEPIASFEDLFL